MKTIDLRSDTITRPSEGMRKAMYEAEVGDDVFREDPTVRKLEEHCAELFGKEAALFVSSGVMGNQLCLRLLTQPADEVICEKDAHIFNYESASPAALSGIQLYPVAGSAGRMPAAGIREAIRPKSAYYMPRSKVICVENTHNRAGGAVLPIEHFAEVREIAEDNGLKFHLDGARIWNASAATGIPVSTYALYVDTLSACFSKGLGAPVGSIIAGTRDLMTEAFRIRKSWGGGMRQVGILAAAALFALQNNLQCIPEDHRRAARLTSALENMHGVSVIKNSPSTNIILFEVHGESPVSFIERVKPLGLLVSVGTTTLIRAVTHLDVSDTDIETATDILHRAIERR